MSRAPAILRGLAFPAAVLLLCQLAAMVSHLQSDTLAAPSAALVAGAHAFADGSMLLATAQTLGNAFGGLALGGGFGLIAGILLGSSATADCLMEFSVEALRPIPSVALIPVAMLIFGFGFRMEIAIVSFASFWPVLILTRNAVAGVDAALFDVARVLRLTPLARTVKIALPAALPRIFVAFRLAAGIALTVAVTVEVSTNPLGLGYGMMLAEQSLHPELMLAYLLWIGIVGWGLNFAIINAQRRLFLYVNARIGWRLVSVAVGGFFIVLWQVVVSAHMVSPVYLPGPDRTWNALVRGFATGTLLAQLLQTVQRMLAGWLLASLAGIVLGACIGLSKPARAYLGPTLEFLRPLPASAVIPLGIAFFGLSDGMVLGVIAFGALWPTLLATVHGFAAVEPCLYEVSRALGMSRLAVIWKIALPSSLPDILGGMRLSLTVSLILAVVGEMLASRTGLGSGILVAARTFHAPDLYAGVVLLGLVGYVTAQALFALEARLLRWRAVR